MGFFSQNFASERVWLLTLKGGQIYWLLNVRPGAGRRAVRKAVSVFFPGGSKDKGSPFLMYLAIPGILVAGPLIGYFGGYLLDDWLGTDPFLGTIGVVLGFVAAGIEIYQLIQRVQAMEKEEDSE
ncbi:hypothetical protein GF377_03310 [candidate division GN15 bacterium]|nr:hypothetical protein [candidate division GN15 bacterium]